MKPDPKIYVTGASCAGVTTLGVALAQRLGVPHVDVDDFYWMPTDPPFTTKRAPEDRVTLIRRELGEGGWVLSGSFDGWGDSLVTEGDRIAFVVTPTPIRMERLMAREIRRHGDRILPGGDMHEIHVAFRQWASQYDVPGFSGRNRARHEEWLSKQDVPVMRLDGKLPPEELAEGVIAAFQD